LVEEGSIVSPFEISLWFGFVHIEILNVQHLKKNKGSLLGLMIPWNLSIPQKIL